MFAGIQYWCIVGLGTANVGLTCVEAGLHAGTPGLLGKSRPEATSDTDLSRDAALTKSHG